MNTKVIAMYLPQYYRTLENDLWWGKGYTDWVAVKNSKPLYAGHQQPRIPYHNDYYDLSKESSILKQAKMAKEYGIFGFGVYHYWFSSDQVLLDKPAYIMKDNPDIDINYFFVWDNGSWKRTWSNVKFSNSWAPMYENTNEGPEVLAELKYGGKEEWKKHFDYLRPFFEDSRYIKIEGKPLFGIFNQDNESKTLNMMFEYWDKCLKEIGIPGIQILGKSNISNAKISNYIFDYEPATHGWNGKNLVQKSIIQIKNRIRDKFGVLKKYDYSRIFNRILKDINSDPYYLPGAFVRYDDSPRRGKKGSIIVGDSPELFEKYMRILLHKSEKLNKKFIFLTAWNEWGEGAYLEPDAENGYAYLEALKRAVESVDVENA